MLDLDQNQAHDFGYTELNERIEAGQLQRIHERTPPQSAEQAKLRNVLGWLADALFFLAIAEKRLINALHENDSLRMRNLKLMQALEGAARLAVAAQRVVPRNRLTELPNRQLLIKRLQLAIRNAAERHRQLALLFIDLDGFKLVNDRFGHALADRLLSGVAARI